MFKVGLTARQCSSVAFNGSVTHLLSPPPAQLSVTVFITPRLHGPYQGSLANEDSRKHLIFLNSGILTMFEGGVTQGPTDNCAEVG